jgi:hypothetical protein
LGNTTKQLTTVSIELKGYNLENGISGGTGFFERGNKVSEIWYKSINKTFEKP